MARPILLNVSGPYAVGKDTMIDAVIARFPDRTHRVTTVTTRPDSGASDPTYTSVSDAQFDRITAQGRWMVNAQLSGATRYATSVDEIEREGAAGRVNVHSVFAGPDGAGLLRETFGARVVSVGLLPSDGSVEDQLRVLERRLVGRDRDDAASLKARLSHQVAPLTYVHDNPTVQTQDGPLHVFDAIVVNDDREAAVARVLELVRASFCLT